LVVHCGFCSTLPIRPLLSPALLHSRFSRPLLPRISVQLCQCSYLLSSCFALLPLGRFAKWLFSFPPVLFPLVARVARFALHAWPAPAYASAPSESPACSRCPRTRFLPKVLGRTSPSPLPRSLLSSPTSSGTFPPHLLSLPPLHNFSPQLSARAQRPSPWLTLLLVSPSSPAFDSLPPRVFAGFALLHFPAPPPLRWSHVVALSPSGLFLPGPDRAAVCKAGLWRACCRGLSSRCPRSRGPALRLCHCYPYLKPLAFPAAFRGCASSVS